MEITKGKTYYIKGCSVFYQKKHPVVANFVKMNEYVWRVDGEDVVSYGIVVSEQENSNAWYPEASLTDTLGE